MTAALGTIGAILFFIALCIVIGFIAWAIVRIHETHVHREALDRRLSEIATGDVPAVPSGFHSVPLTNRDRGNTGPDKVVPIRNTRRRA